MLGIEDYGSDVDSENEASPSVSFPKAPVPAPSKPSGLSLPAPKSSSLSLPPPTKTKRTKKIEITLPSLPSNDSDTDDRPPAKKPRITSSKGAGTSSLLNMLPAPTQPLPVKPKKAERMLGGGNGPGLVFHAPVSMQEDGEGDGEEASMSFLPLSIKKGKSNVNLDHEDYQPQAPSKGPAVNFFSLGTSLRPNSTVPSTSTTPNTSTPTVSSAPEVASFTPPSPTPTDPYPGYYLLPSGAWAAHDQAYYATFVKKWQKEYDAQVRALEKGEVEREAEEAAEVNMQTEMEKARKEIKEREDRKALTGVKTGEPERPRMNVQGAKLGSTARSRHQLTTLLTDAYQNREAMEEKIAQARRNRKEAGNKYGF
ncbi:mitotic checkpoint regulator, MAD2B-interacting-domain-containing protein [Suillus fuscotomentosus]|uniref:Mitotic checkpoint regulator, MAD2B-interacting-domain-containing protein n=1 Tax=Suillus fuscotomentosus TaxID=1912939 RepID=A0AAD4EGS8_9AGAM|nr:mitotic checkpoint regulator, MAD2B-interacting-domain-containing protein [Suillus fuscotomentosus]KAG1905796.1 mitotic checkpoint regulator, MAD2B-interacting-domain-containing protein [Suillus fuscotomentosus]